MKMTISSGIPILPNIIPLTCLPSTPQVEPCQSSNLYEDNCILSPLKTRSDSYLIFPLAQKRCVSLENILTSGKSIGDVILRNFW